MDQLTVHALRRGMWRVVDAGLGSIEQIEDHWPIERFFEAMSYLSAKASEQHRALKEAQAQMGA